MSDTLVLVDGNALVHRAFHAMPPLTTAKGELVNAVYGFTAMLLKAIADLRPRWVAVAFDLPGPTFRHKEFEAYKAQRAKGTEELYQQFRRVRQLVAALGISAYDVEGFEADDVLGSLARQATAAGFDTVIVTGDADALQLVAPNVRVLSPRKGVSDTVLYDEAAVRDRYGVSPAQLTDLKAMVGDPSDNIPGVPGIGEKTAAKILSQFGTVEELLSRIDQADPRQRELLGKHAAQLTQNKRLVTIVTDVPVKLDLDRCRVGAYDREAVLDIFRELEFRTLINRLPPLQSSGDHAGPASERRTRAPEQMSLFHEDSSDSRGTREGISPQVDKEGPPTRYECITTTQQLDDLVTQLEAAPFFAFDTETDNLNETEARLVGISFSVAAGSAAYIPIAHRSPPSQPELQQLPMDTVIERLRSLFEDPGKPKLAHNAKYDISVLARHGIALQGISFDTMLAAYVLQATQRTFGLKDLAFNRLGIEMTPISTLIGTGKKQLSMAEVPIEAATPYASADADVTYRLSQLLGPALREEGLWSVFAEIEMPLVPVLSRMERGGVTIDVPYLKALSKELRDRMIDLEMEVYRCVGHRFNINSTQQLARVLFGELQLDAKRKTKVGNSTAADVLETLRGAHPVVDFIHQYRQLAKLKSTYVDALPLLLNQETGRLHTSFNQTGTVTGRLSSSDPNLQNIPIRTEQGRQVRRAFVADADDDLVLSADYSQVELRILAHITKDPHLVAAFANGEDVHSATASQIFSTSIAEVSSEMRRVAKTINFGVIYGISDYGLAERIGIPRRQAAEFIEAYLGQYEGVRRYVEDIRHTAEQCGYVQTLLGRRRGIPEIRVAHRGAREAALRTAINAPIQGTAADIIKLAMIRLDDALMRRKGRARMVLQVHDELVFNVPTAELAEIEPLVKREMEGAFGLDVPLIVETKTSHNWADIG